MTLPLPAPTAVAWRDRKRPLWLLGIVMPLLPFAGVAQHAVTGAVGWLWIGPLVIVGVVPLIDWTVGRDAANPPDEAIRALEADRYYRWLTYLFLPLQYAGLLLAMHYLATAGLAWVERLGLAVTVGFVGGLGINTAHELGHKKAALERWLSKVALAQTFYGHFHIEHNRGHHVRVATPDDPASSRLGESFYRFWPRSVAGSLASAWQLETRRLARRGQHPFRPGNEVLNAWLLSAGLWAALVGWLGPGILPWLVVQALVGITLLEAVNYLEHYGLCRERVGPVGAERYERVEPRHSWNSNNVATNVLLYHLQRHSDHHAHPTRRYQALRDAPEAPVLPTGYAGMILLALVPPLWRRVMDPRVAAHYGGDLSRANVQPGQRERLERRLPVAAVAVATVAVAGVAPASDRPGPSLDAAEVATDGPVVARCPGCGYTYDERRGAPHEGFPAGTPFARLPDDWCCPDCGVRDKADFLRLRA